ncbi:MAG: gephyrin-like molybdotransferase Glp [Planctomycetota bacterium]
MPGLLSVDEALNLIEQHAEPLAPARVALEDSLGATLAEDITSDVDSPPHDKAMMDGYAVRSGEGAGRGDATLRVIEEVFAGDVPTRAVGAGEATRIMTGAPMPAGADTVVPVEKTESVGDTVRLLAEPPPAGKHVMPRGEAMRAGQVVLERGAVIRAAQVGLLAEVGAAGVPVVQRPTVAVLPTGAELVDAAHKPGPGQTRNSNGPMLLAAAREAGAETIDAGVATDQRAPLRQAILAARGADVLLLSGGVSAGDRDLAPAVLAELGVEKVFHKVAVKPGKPLWFGVWPASSQNQSLTGNPPSPTYVFGLPGNPVSSFVCFHLFARPLIAELAGQGFKALPSAEAELVAGVSQPGGRETYLPARMASHRGKPPLVEPVRWRGSADLVGLSAADALIRLPAEPAELATGDRVETRLLP